MIQHLAFLKEQKKYYGYAFKYSTNLTQIILPNSLETLNQQTFQGAKNVKNIALNSNLINISPLSFYGSGIININTQYNNNYTFENEALYNKEKTKLIVVLTNPTQFVIPEGVIEIGDYAFHNKSNLNSVVIPNTVTTIGESFQHCSNLKQIYIPSSVKTINTNCFFKSGVEEVRVDNTKNAIAGAPWGCTIGDRAIIWLQ